MIYYKVGQVLSKTCDLFKHMHIHTYSHTHTSLRVYRLYIITLFLIIVAVTSCAPHSIKYNSGEIIKFSDVKLSNGIGNIDKFRSSGKFTCEKQGLYLVGAYINSYSFGAQFKIVRNGNMISQVHFRPDSIPKGTSSLHTGTGVIAVQLNVKDTLNVKAGYTNMYVIGSGYSCLTVIKVKWMSHSITLRPNLNYIFTVCLCYMFYRSIRGLLKSDELFNRFYLILTSMLSLVLKR